MAPVTEDQRSAPFEVLPVSGALGAEIRGLDLSKPLDPGTSEKLRSAVIDYGVILLRDQKLSHEQQIAFARTLGEPDSHPIANAMEEYPELLRVHKPPGEAAFFGTSWHTDNTFFEAPSAITILYGVTIPSHGGDTLFASMERAYETLSPKIKTLLDDLMAVHSARAAFDPAVVGDAKYKGEASIKYTMSDAVYAEVEHPVVRTHPESGRKSIFVNPMFTQKIVGLNPAESEAILALLYAHSTRPEFTCRLRWEPGTLVLWDNRSTQHYALNDYEDQERLMYRVTLTGTQPV